MLLSLDSLGLLAKQLVKLLSEVVILLGLMPRRCAWCQHFFSLKTERPMIPQGHVDLESLVQVDLAGIPLATVKVTLKLFLGCM
jgi:hypothetical protein